MSNVKSGKAVGTNYANHIVGRLSGVSATDDRFDAARKAIDLMKKAGLCTKKAEKMLQNAIDRARK